MALLNFSSFTLKGCFKLARSKGSRVQGTKGPRVQGSKGSRIQGFKGLRVQGSKDGRSHKCAECNNMDMGQLSRGVFTSLNFNLLSIFPLSCYHYHHHHYHQHIIINST